MAEIATSYAQLNAQPREEGDVTSRNPIGQPGASSDTWLKDATARLHAVADSGSGVQAHDSIVPQGSAVLGARSILQSLAVMDLPLPHVAPVTGGAVQLEWHRNGRSLEIAAHADGTVDYLAIEDEDYDAAREGTLVVDDAATAGELARWLLQTPCT